MGGEPAWIAESARPLYHAALALGANHLVTLVAQAMELLTAAGVADPGRMLGPLLGAALDNALRSGDAALTGPVAGGAPGPGAAHHNPRARDPPRPVGTELAMARATADRALAGGRLKAETAEALLGVLAEPALAAPRREGDGTGAGAGAGGTSRDGTGDGADGARDNPRDDMGDGADGAHDNPGDGTGPDDRPDDGDAR
jgi:hypothetical protein